MAINYAELTKRLGANPVDASQDGANTFASLEEKYGNAPVAEVGGDSTGLMTSAPQKKDGLLTKVARVVAPIGESVGTALATGGAKKMEQEVSTRQEELSRVALSLIKRTDLSPAQKQRALKALQISKDVGVVDQSGAFNETAAQTFGKGLQTLGTAVAGAGAQAAAKLGLTGAKGVVLSALAEGAVAGGTTGVGIGLQQGETAKQGLETGALAAGITAAIPLIGKIVGKALPLAADALEKANLRLTPTQKTNLGAKIDEVVKYVNAKKIVGTPETRYQKISTIYNQMEKDIQDFLSGGEFVRSTSSRTVPKVKILDEIEKLKAQFIDDRDYASIIKQIDGIKARVDDFPELIPVNRLNNLKRSTFKGAFNKVGDKVNDAVEFQAAEVMKNNIESALDGLKINGKSIGDFNKEYGTVITARKLMKIAKGRNEIGLVGRLVASAVGGGVGSSLGGPLGAGVGLAVGDQVAQKVAGTASRSALAAGLTTADQAGQKLSRYFGKIDGGSTVVDQLRNAALSSLARQ